MFMGMKFVLPIIILVFLATSASAEPLKMPAVPAETLDHAASLGTWIRFGPTLTGGGHNYGGGIIGLLPVQSLASYLGNPKHDGDYLALIRILLAGGNCISANGGYPAQIEHIFLVSLVVARETPTIWNQFTPAEREKIDLLFKAHLVGCAFTTSDKSIAAYPANTGPPSLDGSANQHRDWNPNFREGMIGGLILGACWLGPQQAQAFLDGYDHTAFTQLLSNAGLNNTRDIFRWKIDHPADAAPTAQQVTDNVRGFRFYGKDLAKPMDLYIYLVENTYGATVNAGFNNGAGINGGGKIVQNAHLLPNLGKKGMLLEFDSTDGGGRRSSAGYAYDGFRPNLAKQIALLVTGHFDFNHPKWKDALELIKIGNEDLFFKLENGYINYSIGQVRDTVSFTTPASDKACMRDIWNKVILPYHASRDFKVDIGVRGDETHFADNQSFTLRATTTASGAKYQWFINGVPIEGETKATYTTMQTDASAEYHCQVTANGVTMETERITITTHPFVPSESDTFGIYETRLAVRTSEIREVKIKIYNLESTKASATKTVPVYYRAPILKNHTILMAFDGGAKAGYVSTAHGYMWSTSDKEKAIEVGGERSRTREAEVIGSKGLNVPMKFTIGETAHDGKDFTLDFTGLATMNKATATKSPFVTAISGVVEGSGFFPLRNAKVPAGGEQGDAEASLREILSTEKIPNLYYPAPCTASGTPAGTHFLGTFTTRYNASVTNKTGDNFSEARHFVNSKLPKGK